MQTWRKVFIIGGSIGYLGCCVYELYLNRKAAKEKIHALEMEKHKCDLELDAEMFRHELTMKQIEKAAIDDKKLTEDEFEYFKKRIKEIDDKYRMIKEES